MKCRAGFHFIHYLFISYKFAGKEGKWIAIEDFLVTFVPIIGRMEKYLVIERNTEYLRIPTHRLVYVSSDGNYSYVWMQDCSKQMVSLQLGLIEDKLADLMGDDCEFVRIGKSLIVNIDFVHQIDISKQKLVLSDCFQCKYDLTASREALLKLKSYIMSK